MRTILGFLWLAGLVIRSGFRLGGAYWTWRSATAMGEDRPGRGERLTALLHYARWLERMRSISR